MLFLDELNSIPYGVQSKLLRVLQDGTFRPLGSNRDKHVNVKVIAAMNIDPVEAMEKNIIRSDLFYRLSGGLISLLPLRERKEDIKLFIDYYIRAFSATYNKNVEAISPEAERIFLEYPWPGNVRELRNTIESMIVTLKDGNTISEKEIPLYIKERMKLQLDNSQKEKRPSDNGGENWTQEFEGDEDGVINYHEIMETVEKKLIEKAIAKSGGNIKEAGRLLGIPRETLRYRIKKLGMEEE